MSAKEQAIRAAAADIRYGGTRAYYDRLTDHIQIPESADFIGSPTSTPQESFYSTVFHELAHNADIRIMPRRAWRLPEPGAFRRGCLA